VNKPGGSLTTQAALTLTDKRLANIERALSIPKISIYGFETTCIVHPMLTTTVPYYLILFRILYSHDQGTFLDTEVSFPMIELKAYKPKHIPI